MSYLIKLPIAYSAGLRFEPRSVQLHTHTQNEEWRDCTNFEIPKMNRRNHMLRFKLTVNADL